MGSFNPAATRLGAGNGRSGSGPDTHHQSTFTGWQYARFWLVLAIMVLATYWGN